MKIIVTGCRGQLGTEIIKQLREGRSELGPIPEKLVSATVIPVDLPELDITNYKMVDDFIRRQRPDVIINCAGMTDVAECEKNIDEAYRVNAIGVRNVVENKVDLTKSRNLIIAGVIFVCGLGFSNGLSFTSGGTTVTLTALAIAAIAGILLNMILPGNDYEFGVNESGDENRGIHA